MREVTVNKACLLELVRWAEATIAPFEYIDPKLDAYENIRFVKQAIRHARQEIEEEERKTLK